MADYIPIAVPATPADARDKNAELTEEHEKKRQEVLAHFDKEDYHLDDSCREGWNSVAWQFGEGDSQCQAEHHRLHEMSICTHALF